MTQPLILGEQLDEPSVSDVIHPVGSGTQIQSVFGSISSSNGTTTIPFDASRPSFSEGSEVGAGTIGCNFETSSVLVQFSLTLDASAINEDIVVAVFRNHLCIASSLVTIDANGKPKTLSMTIIDETPAVPAGSPLTGGGSPELVGHRYSGRVGLATGGATWYVNSTSTGDDMGGTLQTHFVLTELK